MTTAIIGMEGLDRPSPACGLRRARTCGSRTPTWVGTEASGTNRWSCDRRRRATAASVAGRRRRRPGPCVWSAQGRHGRDRCAANRHGRGRPEATRSASRTGNVVGLLPEGQASGEVVAGWLPAGAAWPWHLGAMSAELLRIPPATAHRSWRSCRRDRRRSSRRGGRAA